MEKLNLDIEKFTQNRINEIGFTPTETGFKSLDKAMSGGIRPGVTVLGAAPGTGKSTLAYQLACAVSAAGNPVLIFSLEMSRNQILAKMLSRQTHILDPDCAVTVVDMLNLRRSAKLSKRQWDVIEEATRIVDRQTENIIVNDGYGQGVTAAAVRDDIAEYMEQNPGASPLVIVDYLQFLAPGNTRSQTDRQVVEENVKILTECAGTYRIPLLLISSINRDSYDEDITMKSFKETGSIEYSADALIGMTSVTDPKTQKRVITLSFLKQRYGRADICVDLDYDPRYDRITDPGKGPYPKPPSTKKRGRKKSDTTDTTYATDEAQNKEQPGGSAADSAPAPKAAEADKSVKSAKTAKSAKSAAPKSGEAPANLSPELDEKLKKFLSLTEEKR